MHENEKIRWHGNYGMNAGQCDDGVTASYVSADKKPCPREVKMAIDACRSLRADALVLELPDHAIVVALNNYDGTYAAAACSPDAHFPLVARGLQVRLYSEPGGDSPADFLPTATVRSVMDRWECQIASVFGRHYAARLIMDTTGEKAPGELSQDDLERIRLHLSSATGGCLIFQKVDK